MAVTYCQGAYYGKLLNSGWGANPAHQLAGETYAVDEDTFQIIGFTFDGNAPGKVVYSICCAFRSIFNGPQ